MPVDARQIEKSVDDIKISSYQMGPVYEMNTAQPTPRSQPEPVVYP